MKDFLPLFPLKMVVFPGEELNLHIFEPRYKQLIRECEENGITFGIPAFLNDEVMEIGTEIELISVEKRHNNGELDIKTRGVATFKIETFFQEAPQKLYAGADIKRRKEINDRELELNEEILELLRELFLLLGIDKVLPSDPEAFYTFEIAHHVGFSLEQEYEYLCLDSELKRQLFIRNHLVKLIPVVREMERLRQKALLNGHFKNAIPPDIKM